ncbi:MAG: hypothetical protein CMF62_01495 [Magnetococcales bacterium]|nr:hypothetical protein [Magnetococcales bacterium]|tara:strand:+ start:27409 stop:30327 length:2919 start_codon:yes stop_codon:yes gene_type:complete
MATIPVKDFKIYNLQNEYRNLATFLQNIQFHINRRNDMNSLTVTEKNQHLKNIDEMLRNMNTTYNNHLMKICEIDSDDESGEQLFEIGELANKISDDQNLYLELRKMASVSKDLGIGSNDKLQNMILDNPFLEIKKKLMNLGNKVGFRTLNDCLKLNLGEYYDTMLDNEIIDLLKLYNDIFIPIEAQIIKPRKLFNKNLTLRKISPLTETLIESCCEIIIRKENTTKSYFSIKGYFEIDSLNIFVRTSQICYNFIYTKKKEIEELLSTRTDIDDRFKRLYVRNSPISDFLILDSESYIEQIEKDYTQFRHFKKLSFMNKMKEFVKDINDIDCIQNMYNIIKLLLLGSDENINEAGLLFGITKDRKEGDEIVSNLIYRNLSYVSQIKLRKTSVGIKNELEKIKSLTIDDIDLKKHIAINKNMPDYVKKLAMEKIEEMKASNNEYYKQLLYVKTLVNYPWPSEDDDMMFRDIGSSKLKSQEFLNDFVKRLDNNVYGHKDCKSTFKELLGRWLTNPTSFGSAIGLVGPPGVGKTLIAKQIGKALDIPFVQITLGGQNDGEILHGHGYTYSGAQPGIIIKKMAEAGSARCIMYFDELDKASKKHDSNEIFNILIHLTDPNMNSEFQDRFFQEVKFPLDKVIFIFSYNDSELIDRILLDRIEEIPISSYSSNDKVKITKDFLLKEASNAFNLEEGSIKIDDDVTKFLIEEYTNEAGVRELKRKIEKIFSKLNIDNIYEQGIYKKHPNPTPENPLIIDKDTVIEYLSKPRVSVQNIHSKDMVGVINGMYATDNGSGGIIPIQVYPNHTGNKFNLKLTGYQKKVMRESVKTAFTAATQIIKPDIVEQFKLNNPSGLHIHTPNGGTPKDGPSAGCAFGTAFISRILNKKIRKNIAMTGEIDTTGKVTKIGGLQYKLTGAKKAGVTFVMVSKENEEDVTNIKKDDPELIDGKILKVVLVDKLQDVLKHSLIGYSAGDFIKN